MSLYLPLIKAQKDADFQLKEMHGVSCALYCGGHVPAVIGLPFNRQQSITENKGQQSTTINKKLSLSDNPELFCNKNTHRGRIIDRNLEVYNSYDKYRRLVKIFLFCVGRILDVDIVNNANTEKPLC